MTTTLYAATRPSSATPVEQAFIELGIPHQTKRLDLEAGEQHDPAFLALNPNGLVPTLVVDDQPLFEGLAIIQYLGDRDGVERGLWPAPDTAERLQALSWTTWAYAHLQWAIRIMMFAGHPMVPAELHHAPLEKHARKLQRERLEVLEAHLDGRDYIVGDRYSLVDLTLASLLGWGVSIGVDLEGLPRISAWLGQCTERPSYREIYGTTS